MLDLVDIKNSFPINYGKISLHIFKEKDITDQYVSWLNDSEVVKFSNQRFKEHTKTSCHEYYKTFKSSNGVFLSIFSENNKAMIGTMTVYFNTFHNTADIGILIGDRGSWGKGFGKDSWLGVIELLVKKNIRKITAGTLSCNYGMLKIMTDAGMHNDGIRKDQELVDGKPYDILHFAKFNQC